MCIWATSVYNVIMISKFCHILEDSQIAYFKTPVKPPPVANISISIQLNEAVSTCERYH